LNDNLNANAYVGEDTHLISPTKGTTPGSTNPLDISEECATCHQGDGLTGPCRRDAGTGTVRETLVPGTLVHARPAPKGPLPTGTAIVMRPWGKAPQAVSTLLWFFPLGMPTPGATVHAMLRPEITPLRTTLDDLLPDTLSRLAQMTELARRTTGEMRPLAWTLARARNGSTSETRRCRDCLTDTPANRAECVGCSTPR
jgi:uncharacterized protein DUF6409